MENKLTAHQVAINLVKAYAERGDDVDQFRGGQLGSYGSGHGASVGGYVNHKRYPTTKIVVSKVNGEEVEEIFSLYEIWNEVLQSKVQPTLL